MSVVDFAFSSELVMGFVNSSLALTMMSLLAPTLNFEVGQIRSLPFLPGNCDLGDVVSLVQSNIALSRADWDSLETSWDFKRNPLV